MKHVSSGSRLVDWHFNKVINALNEGIETIRIKKRMPFKDGVLYGTLEDDVICLNKSAHRNLDQMARTLLHEVLHYVFEDFSEEDIVKLENLIWDQLSRKQKDILKFYLPKLR